MFSEYASRFLAQSQSRISNFRQPSSDNNGGDGQRQTSTRNGRQFNTPSRFQNTRSYLQRPTIGNPYQAAVSNASPFSFASRTSAAPAPLLYSVTDEFREQDDEDEREREVADLYALQRSRRHFGASHLEESSEIENDESRSTLEGSDKDARDADNREYGQGRGIKSSWRGALSTKVEQRRKGVDVATPGIEESNLETGSPGHSSKGRHRMVDIGLGSTMEGSVDLDEPSPPHDIAIHRPHDDNDDDNPPAFQTFREPRASKPLYPPQSPLIPYQTDEETAFERPRPPSSAGDSAVPPTITLPLTQPPRHDPFWSWLYIICLASIFSSFFIVFLHTSTPTKKHPLGDTIYSTLRSSYHLLAVDTLVAVLVALLWLQLLRSFVRPLVLTILFSVPVIMVSFSLYPFISSFRGTWNGESLQDRVMRWMSIIPAIAAGLWLYTIYSGRRSFDKAIGILEFACRIIAESPALMLLGFATLAGVVVWTWLWMAMFTRIFLGGHITAKNLFIVDVGSWWLGVWFVLNYLWTLSVLSGIQRATTAATVSQWYFHRRSISPPSSTAVVQAALSHALTTSFGTICLSTLLSLLVRLPLLLLPRRITALIGLFTYSLIPTPIAALTNPLTLTHAAIHSQPLTAASRGIGQMTFLAPNSPTTALHPRTFSTKTTQPLLPYRLAKLLLHATRTIMSFALGVAGWVTTARMMDVEGSKLKGSLYAYVVGLIAGTIGWAVLGAMEGVLGGVVDAGVICWGSESRETGAAAGYCNEAAWLFGDEEAAA